MKPDVIDPIKEKELLDIKKGSPELLIKLLEKFVEVFITTIEKMESSLQNSAFKEMASLIHGLKGSAGTLGLKKMHELIIEEEKCLKNNDSSTFSNFVKSANEELEQVKKYLDDWKNKIK